MPTKQFLRIIDANFNRAKEALRVAEDLARFCMNHKSLTARFKRCRHDLTEVLYDFPGSYAKLVRARDSAGDVGKKGWIQDGKRKPRWQDLMIANLKRAQEAVRVLEEMAKVISPRQAPRFQGLRFRLYELEKRSLRQL